MSLNICANCLSRLRISPNVIRPALLVTPNTSSSFHSSAVQHANPIKKKSTSVQASSELKHRTSRSARIKKQKRDKVKPRPIGELRALRKRIVLSNTNALEVQGMEDLSPENMCGSANVGKMMGLEGPLLDQLRDAKAFKTTQSWNLFRRPATLIREDTVNVGHLIKDVNKSVNSQGQSPQVFRQIITGDRATGKSILLLQAMSMAYMNNWVVINVPEAQEYTTNQSAYAPLQRHDDSTEQLYIQPQLTADLLGRIVYSNENVLSSLKQNHAPPENLPIGKKASLKDLAQLGAENHTLAWPAWEQLWKELTRAPTGTSGSPRPPVLVTIDGIDHWMGLTKYRSADFNLIHAHQFTLVKEFLALLFSNQSQSLPNGGMILAATTASSPPAFPSFPVLLRQLAARAAGLSLMDQSFPMPGPYTNPDLRVLDLLKNTQHPTVKALTGLSKSETRGLLEYFARSGILKETITDTLVGEKWMLSGSGVVGEMIKLGKRNGNMMEESLRNVDVGMWPGQGLNRARK